MIRKVHKTARNAGITFASLGATLALFGSAMTQYGIANATEAGAPCEFYFYPAQPGAKITEGSPLPGRIEVSPGCEFFQFPNKSEEQLVTEPGVTDLTGTYSHFRISPNGDLLFIIEPPQRTAESTATPEAQVDKCSQPSALLEQEIERNLAELSRAHDNIAALEARLTQTQTALDISKAQEQGSQNRIGQLVAEMAALTEQTTTHRQGLEEAHAEAKSEVEQLGTALEQAQTAEQDAQTQIAALNAELSALTDQTTTERQGIEEAKTQAQTEIARLGAALKQTQAVEQSAQDRISALETELATLTKQAAEDRKDMETAMAQGEGEIARLGSALEQAQAAEQNAQTQITALEAELAALTEQTTTRRQGLEEAHAQSKSEVERLGTALQQAQAAGQAAQDRIDSLDAELAALTDQATAEHQRSEEARTQARSEIERLNAALEQAQAAGQISQDRTGALETELAALTEQAATDHQGMEEAKTQAETEIARLGAALQQAQAAGQAAQDRIDSLDAELAALTDQATAQRQSSEEARSQARNEIDGLDTALEQARAAEQVSQDRIRVLETEITQVKADATSRIAGLEKAGEQAQSEAAARAGQLTEEIARLKRENTALAPWAGRHRECTAGSERCAADLAAKGLQIDRMTHDLEATKQELQGLAGDADRDGVGDARDQCPDTPANLATDAVGCVSIDLLGVEFASGSDQLREASEQILNSTAKLLKEIKFPIEIQGHTDSYGDPEANLQLSEDRARAVLSYLVEQGVPADSLTAKGYGDTKPIANNETPEGRSDNRRVEITRRRQ